MSGNRSNEVFLGCHYSKHATKSEAPIVNAGGLLVPIPLGGLNQYNGKRSHGRRWALPHVRRTPGGSVLIMHHNESLSPELQ